MSSQKECLNKTFLRKLQSLIKCFHSTFWLLMKANRVCFDRCRLGGMTSILKKSTTLKLFTINCLNLHAASFVLIELSKTYLSKSVNNYWNLRINWGSMTSQLKPYTGRLRISKLLLVSSTHLVILYNLRNNKNCQNQTKNFQNNFKNSLKFPKINSKTIMTRTKCKASLINN